MVGGTSGRFWALETRSPESHPTHVLEGIRSRHPTDTCVFGQEKKYPQKYQTNR